VALGEAGLKVAAAGFQMASPLSFQQTSASADRQYPGANVLASTVDPTDPALEPSRAGEPQVTRPRPSSNLSSSLANGHVPVAAEASVVLQLDAQHPKLRADSERAELVSGSSSFAAESGALILDDESDERSLAEASQRAGVLLLDVELADAAGGGTGVEDSPSHRELLLDVEWVDAAAAETSASKSDVEAPRLAEGVANLDAASSHTRFGVGFGEEGRPQVGPEEVSGPADGFPHSSSGAFAEEASTQVVTTLARTAHGTVGLLPLKISHDSFVSVRLADLISLFEDSIDRPLFVWLKSSSSAGEYVTEASLKSAGIDIDYNASVQQVALSIAGARAR
jgi:hypothetical protein